MKIKQLLIILITIFSFATAIAVAIYLYFNELNTKILALGKLWNEDIARAVSENNTFAIRRLSETSSLYLGHSVTFRLDSDQSNAVNCNLDIKTPVMVANAKIAELRACVPFGKFVLDSITQPTSVLLFAILSFGTLAAYIVPLLHHRRSLLKTIETIESMHRFGIEADLKLQKGDLVGDRVSAIIRKMIQSEIEIAKRDQEKLAADQINLLIRRVAHDIRSPLTALLALINSTKRNGKINDEATHVELLELTATRIRSISDDLLRETKPKSWAEQTSSSPKVATDLNHSILAIIKEKKALPEFSNVSFHYLQPRTAVPCLINPVDIERILSNIFNNSQEAFSNGSGTISVRLETFDDNAIIQISDNGCGLSAEHLEMIRRSQLSIGKANSKTSGNSLGLSHAYEKIAEWHGRIRIDSTLGIGTRVEIQLPCIETVLHVPSNLRVTKLV